MDKEQIRKAVQDYKQQAEVMLANYHRLTGAALALEELIKTEKAPEEDVPSEEENSLPADQERTK